MYRSFFAQLVTFLEWESHGQEQFHFNLPYWKSVIPSYEIRAGTIELSEIRFKPPQEDCLATFKVGGKWWSGKTAHNNVDWLGQNRVS